MNTLPAGWAIATFGQLIEKMSNGMPGTQNKEGLGIPVSRIETIADQTINFSRIGYIAEYDNQTVERFRIRCGDVLFSHINSPAHIGKTALFKSENPLYHGINLLRIQINSEVCLPEYFNYACRLLRVNGAFSLNAQHAVNQSSLNQSKIAAFEIPLSPLPEQRRIADKLDTVLARVDAVNERLARVVPLLKRLRQSVLAAATSGRLTEDWRIAMRVEWRPTRMRVSDLGEVVTGSTPTKKEAAAYGGTIPFYKPSDLDAGYHIDSASEYLTELGASMSRLLPEKAVLVTCIGATIGKCGLARQSGATNQQINAVICNGIALPEWLFFWFSSPYGKAAVTENASATTLPILNKSKFSVLELDVPSIDEQTEIVRRVELLFAYADRLEARLRAAQTATERLTPALLAKAFRGELVPQDPNDEPAAQLLQRLQASQATAAPKRRKARAAPVVQD